MRTSETMGGQTEEGLNNKGFVRALLYPARLYNVHVHLNNQYLYR